MLRQILIGLSLFTAIAASAQKKVVTPASAAAAATDYKQMGSPMPEIVVLAFHDTTTKKDTGLSQEHKTKKRRKRLEPDTYVAKGPQELITNQTLKSNGNLFVMMFNPTCGHCDAMATLMEEHIDMFNRSKILLLANQQMIAYLPEFASRHHIQDHTGVYMGTDSSGFIDNVFLYQALPQINIYDAERRLIKTYAGETPFDSLKKYIN